MYLLRDNPVKAPNRAIRPALRARARVALICTAVTTSAAAAWAQCPPLPAAPAGSSVACRYDSTLTRTFTPRAAPAGSYRVYVSSSPLPKVAEQLRGSSPDRTSPGWDVQEMDPLDAFGNAGPYDQTSVARLYVGRRARVARGPLVQDGRVTASIWLISPYPDPSLSRLEPGTLIIEFRVPGPTKSEVRSPKSEVDDF